MSEEQLELPREYCTEVFDIEAFKTDVWAAATEEQKAYAISLNFNQGDVENVQSSLFRDALIYGYSELVEFLWEEATEDQQKDILEYSENFTAFQYTWTNATEAKEAGALENILKNFNFILGQYDKVRQSEIVEHNDYEFWPYILDKPSEIFNAFWEYTNVIQKKSILKDKGVLKWFGKNLVHPNAALLLSVLAEFGEAEIFEKYSSIFEKMVVGRKKGQTQEDIEALIKNIVELTIEDDSKDALLQVIFYGFGQHIAENYKMILLVTRVIPNEKFMGARNLVFNSIKEMIAKAIGELEPKEIEALVKDIIDSTLEDDSKEKLLLPLVRKLAEDVTKNYDTLLTVYDLIPNSNFMKVRASFIECDKARVNDFKRKLKSTKKEEFAYHQVIGEALKRSFQYSKKNVLDILFDNGDYKTLKRIFNTLYSPMTYDVKVVEQCEALALKFLGKLPEYISEPKKADEKQKYELFKQLVITKNLVEEAKKAAEEKAKKQAKINGDDELFDSAYSSGDGDLTESDNDDSDSSDSSDDDELNYFSYKNWKTTKKDILDNLFEEGNINRAVSRALDNLARHARWSLNSKSTSERATAGQAKYKALQTLFERLGNAESLDDAKQELEAVLDQHNPKQSVLLQNRGGCGGFYQKVSDTLGKHGFFHFHYEHNGVSYNAPSSTARELNALYDAVNGLEM